MVQTMTSDPQSSPLPPSGGDKSSGSPAVVPVIHRLVTRLSLVYEVGKPYPQLDQVAVKHVPAVVARITEGADDGGPVYLVRCEPTAPELAGHVFMDIIPGDAVRDAAGILPESEWDDLEDDLADDADAGLEVQRVTVPLGVFGAHVYEVGADVPSLPPPYTALAGRVERILREPSGMLWIKVRPPSNHPVLGGSGIWTVQVFEYHNALEILTVADADALESQSVQESYKALASTLPDGDDVADSEDDDDDADDDTAPETD